MADAPSFPLDGRRIWVAGHNGMVGRALMRALAGRDCELLTIDHAQLDLTRQAETEDWIAETRPDAIIIAAARVGGIQANIDAPAAFLYENLMIAANIIHAAARLQVGKLVYLGSSCIYPRESPQPIVEESLMTGPLEPTNAGYALAKIAGVQLCRYYRQDRGCDFISAMPTNLYGPHDNFDARTAHVLPALLARIGAAAARGDATVTIWGSGTPRREFLHVDDLASAITHLMQHYSAGAPINVGSGAEISIAELAGMIGRIVGFRGGFTFDTGKPDGMPRKLIDSRRLRALGWQPRIDLEQGLADTWAWYRAHFARDQEKLALPDRPA